MKTAKVQSVSDVPSYCPYPVLNQPDVFGLRTHEFESAYGNQTWLMSAAAEASSRTLEVYLHGVGGSWASWTPLLQHQKESGFASSARAAERVFVNLPGYGWSENTRRDLDIAAVGDMIMAELSSFGMADRRVRLVGHSMGGFLALDLANRYEEEIADVRLVCGAPLSVLAATKTSLRVNLRDRPKIGSALAIMTLLRRLGPSGKALVWSAHRAGLMPMMLRNTTADPRALRKDVLKVTAEELKPIAFSFAMANGPGYDPAVRWGAVRQPVRALFGAYDGLVPPSDGLELQELLPQAEVAVEQNAGHYLPIERPDVLAAFLEGDELRG